MAEIPVGTQAVYDAERYVQERHWFTGRDELDLIEQAEKFASRVVAGPVWAEYRGPRLVFLEIGRSKRWGGTASRETDDGDPATIRISASRYGRKLILHEMAHLIAGPRSGHRPPFVRAYLRLLEAHAGDLERDELLLGLIRCAAPGRWQLPYAPPWLGQQAISDAAALAGLRNLTRTVDV